ncbi:MAG: OB-fold domain-containing protein [Caulobacterales bacterium]
MADDTNKEWPRPVKAPQPSRETQTFWDAAKDGKFLFKRCNACGEPHYFPRASCPFCWSEDTVWEEASGEGVIYAFTIIRRSPTGPYSTGFVELKEGPCVFTNFVKCDFEKLTVGQKVKVVFQPGEDGGAVPMWAPV